MMADNDRLKLPEKECPECHGEISWIIVRDEWGSPQANGHCGKCSLVFRNREAPEITEGMELEHSGSTKGIPAMDERITRLPCDVQLGILRERQHPDKRRKSKQ